MTQLADDNEGPFVALVGQRWEAVVLENEDSAVGAAGGCQLGVSSGGRMIFPDAHSP